MKIYKYTPHIKLFVESSAIKLTPTFQLNDPFESKITDEFISNYESKLKEVFKGDYELLTKNIKNDLKSKGSYTGVISLSKTNLDILMLSHYASEHQGGILEFEIDPISNGFDNLTNIFERTHDKKYTFGRVDYNKKRKCELNDDYHEYLSKGVYFDKYKGWDYEEEVRYVSDFRFADYFIIPKKELVNSYFKRLQDNSFYDLISVHVESSNYYYIFEGFDDESGESRYYRSKDRTIISILEGRSDINISSYRETEDSLIIELAYEDNDSFYIDNAMFWRSFLDDGCAFHPMLKVKKEALTGIYLGCKFDINQLCDMSFSEFPNLSNNIKRAELCGNDFKLNLVEIPELSN